MSPAILGAKSTDIIVESPAFKGIFFDITEKSDLSFPLISADSIVHDASPIFFTLKELVFVLTVVKVPKAKEVALAFTLAWGVYVKFSIQVRDLLTSAFLLISFWITKGLNPK